MKAALPFLVFFLICGAVFAAGPSTTQVPLHKQAVQQVKAGQVPQTTATVTTVKDAEKVKSCVRDTSYPADKKKIVEHCKFGKTLSREDESWLDKHLPEKNYENAVKVLDELRL